MFDLKTLNSLYETYLSFVIKFNNMSKECKRFYKEHKKELIPLQKEYDTLDFSTDAPKEFLRNNDILRNFNSIKFLKDYYEKRKFSCLHDDKCCKQNGKIALLIDEYLDKQYFYDTETQEILDLSNYQSKQIEFMISILINSNSFIGKVDYFDLALISNIANQVSIDDVKLRNKKIYSEYTKTIKDSKKKPNHKELKKRYEQVNNIKSERIKKLSLNDITYDEFLIDMYAFKILSGENIDKMFLSGGEVDKKNIINAYVKVSSYDDENPYGINYRTSSQLINDEVYIRTKRKR